MKANKGNNPKDNTKKKTNKNQEEEVEVNFRTKNRIHNCVDDVVSVPCTRCGNHNCVDGTDFCEECLVKMLNTRVPFIGWVAGAASLVLAVVAIAASVFLVSPSILGVRAEKAAREKNWNDAIFYYDQMDKTLEDFSSLIEWKEGAPEPFLRRFFKLGANTDAKMFEAYAKMFGSFEAVIRLDVNSNMPLTKTKRAKPYWEQFKRIENTQNIIFYSDELPENTYEASIEFIEKKEKNNSGVDKVYAAYLKYLMAAEYYNQPIEAGLKWLRECDKLAKESGEDYRWMYYYDLAGTLNVTGKPDEALKLLDELVAENRNNFNAYKQKVDILIENSRLPEAEKLVNGLGEEFGNYNETVEMQLKIARCKGDYDKVIVLGDTLMADYAATPETYRQMALMFLAKGDYKSAFEYIESGYSKANLEYQQEGAERPSEKLVETCFVCAKLYEKHGELTDKDKIKVNQFLDMYSDDYETTPDGEAIIKGEKSAKEILTQGDCDLA